MILGMAKKLSGSHPFLFFWDESYISTTSIIFPNRDGSTDKISGSIVLEDTIRRL